MDDLARATQAATVAAYRLDAASAALQAHLNPRASVLFEAVLDAATELLAAEQDRLIHELAAYFPGLAPAIVAIAEQVKTPNA